MEKILEKNRISFRGYRLSCLSFIFALVSFFSAFSQKQIVFTINEQVGTNQKLLVDSTGTTWAIVSDSNKHILYVPALRLVSASGTANYIPKFVASNALSNSVVYETGFRIGIGKTNPESRLDVSGTTTQDTSFVKDYLALGSKNQTDGAYAFNIKRAAPAWALASFQNTDTTGYTALRFFNSTGVRVASFGVGNSGVPAPFRNNFYLTTQNSTANIVLSTQNIERLRVTPAGNVGIGNIDPNAANKLEVAGTMLATQVRGGTNTSYVQLQNYSSASPRVNTSGTTLDLAFGNNLYFYSTGDIQRMKLTTTGLRIGTGDPSYALDVSGNVGWGGALYVGSPTWGIPLSAGSTGQFLKRNDFLGVAYNQWANIGISDVSSLQANLDAKLDTSGVRGSAGYLSKFTATRTLRNSILYETGSNIAIGGTAASSKLSFAPFWDSASETVGINFSQGYTSGSLPAYGIGFGPASTEGYLSYRSGTASSSAFGHKWFVNNSELMRLRGDGRLGLGTNNPSYLLDVNGTARFSGYFGIGTSPLSTSALTIDRPISGGTTAFGIALLGTIQSSVSSQAIYNYTQLNTQATSFTLPYAKIFSAGVGSIGAGSSVTNIYGFHVESTLGVGTNTSYAFISEMSAGTGRWNLYMSGTANNYLAGSLGIGTNNPSYLLDVNGAARFSQIVGGGSTPTASAGAGAGTGPTVSITGTSSGFHVDITAGTSPTAGADVVTVTFPTTYTTTPYIVFSETAEAQYYNADITANTRDCSVYVTSKSATSFKLKAKTNRNLIAGQVYSFDFHIIK